MEGEFIGPPLPLVMAYMRMRRMWEALKEIGSAFGEDTPLTEEDLLELGLAERMKEKGE